MTRLIDDRVSMLFDLLVSSPKGVTRSQIATYLGIPRGMTGRVIRKFRLTFASEVHNLTATPNGWNGEWLYTLDADSEIWAANRVRDAESRLETMDAMMQSVVKATSPRTLVGRKARRMEVAFRHLQEDLANLAAEYDLKLGI